MSNNYDTLIIDEYLVRKKDGSCVSKRYEDVKTTQQVNWEYNNSHDTPKWKQGPRGTLDPLAEMVSWEEQHRPIDVTKTPTPENIPSSIKKTIYSK